MAKAIEYELASLAGAPLAGLVAARSAKYRNLGVR
jgi:hypothetical protein